MAYEVGLSYVKSRILSLSLLLNNLQGLAEWNHAYKAIPKLYEVDAEELRTGRVRDAGTYIITGFEFRNFKDAQNFVKKVKWMDKKSSHKSLFTTQLEEVSN